MQSLKPLTKEYLHRRSSFNAENAEQLQPLKATLYGQVTLVIDVKSQNRFALKYTLIHKSKFPREYTLTSTQLLLF